MTEPDIWPDFSRRSRRDEWMEDSAIADTTLVETFDAIDRISRWTGGARTSLAGLEQLVEPSTERLSILDVGAGHGTMARDFADWGRERGIAVDVFGIDLLAAAVETARTRFGHRDDLHFARKDLLEFDPDRRFDVVHASLVLHHFPDAEADLALSRMAELSAGGVIVNDLHRHPVHWLSSKLVLPFLTGNRLAIHDGPISVLRGFQRRELVELARRSTLRRATVEWRFPFRWLLIGER